MDVFGANWANHLTRLEENWHAAVQHDDTVIIAGDTDWALYLDDAMETIDLISSWPGRKILLRGNHDYWWSSKTTSKVRNVLPSDIVALHNDAVQIEGFNICGAKGSPVPGGIDWTPQHAKLLNREEQRLEMSLAASDPSLPIIVAMHYPPFFPSSGPGEYCEILERWHVACVVYGHLHGAAATSGPANEHSGVRYRIVAGDAVEFRPVLIARDGKLTIDGGRKEIVAMSEEQDPESLRSLVNAELEEKRREVGSEAEAEELYDLPVGGEELAESLPDREKD